MDIDILLWGRGEHLSILQMTLRGLVIFLVAYLLLRIGGKRIFGKKSAFDYVIIIVMGSVLARVVVGASSFWPAVAASLMMVLLNRIFSIICAYSPMLNRFLNGAAVLLYVDGHVLWDNLRKVSLTFEELRESLHLEMQMDDFENVQQAFMETNGRISFIVKSSKN